MLLATINSTRYELLVSIDIRGKQTQFVVQRGDRKAGVQALNGAKEIMANGSPLQNGTWVKTNCGLFGRLVGVVGLFKITTKREHIA